MFDGLTPDRAATREVRVHKVGGLPMFVSLDPLVRLQRVIVSTSRPSPTRGVKEGPNSHWTVSPVQESSVFGHGGPAPLPVPALIEDCWATDLSAACFQAQLRALAACSLWRYQKTANSAITATLIEPCVAICASVMLPMTP